MTDVETVDRDGLVHELLVHQAELEMQNEELRLAQLGLEQSRDRYAQLYDHAPVGYVTLDRTGRVLEANFCVADLLRLDRGALIGRRLSSFLSEADGDLFHHYRRDVFASTSKRVCELAMRRTDGVIVTIRLESIVDANAPPSAPQCQTVLIDVSDLRAAEDGLVAQESKSQAIHETAADAMITIDADKTIESLNPAAERMFGYQAEELVGRKVDLLVANPDAHDDYFKRFVTSGVATAVGEGSREFRGRRKDGTTFPLEVGMGEWSDHAQRKFTAILRDLSARDMATAQLRESEQRFRQIAENVEDGLYLLEVDGTISYRNPAYQRIVNGSPCESHSTREDALRLVHLNDVEAVRAADLRFRRGEPYDEEYRLTRADGAVRWVRERIFTVEDKDRTVLRFVGLLTDSTDERALEEELRQAQKMEAVGTLASGVAHDFRNLLQGIGGCAHMVLRRGTEDEESSFYVEQIAAAAKRGAALTDQLMAFSYRQECNARPVDFEDVLRRSSILIERLVGEHISVNTDYLANGAVIMADPIEIEQVVLNLASNAADAMPKGGRLSLRTDDVIFDEGEAQRRGLASPGRYVQLTVRDSGQGMDEATQRRIFEPFFTTKDVDHGTGLGLSRVFAITRKLGGHVEVCSTVGVGSVFTFQFPCCHEAAEVVAVGPTSSQMFSGTVLLVEDDPLVRLSMRVYLEELGFEVVQAGGAAEALVQMARAVKPFDLLVTDVTMPQMCGPELAVKLRQVLEGLPVLFVSAHSHDVLIRRGTVKEDAALLRKPFGREELSAALSTVLGSSGRRHGAPLEAPTPPRKTTREPRPTPARIDATIVVVEDSDAARVAICGLFSTMGYTVIGAAKPSEAIAATTGLSRPIDLLLTDLSLPEMDGVALAHRFRDVHGAVPVIFMSGLPDPPSADEGDFIEKPIDLDVLAAMVQKRIGE